MTDRQLENLLFSIFLVIAVLLAVAAATGRLVP